MQIEILHLNKNPVTGGKPIVVYDNGSKIVGYEAGHHHVGLQQLKMALPASNVRELDLSACGISTESFKKVMDAFTETN